MALEQLRAFQEELPLEQLGSTDLLAPDNYPLLRVSELGDEHKVVSQMLGLSQGGFLRDHGIRDKLMLEERPFSDVLHSDDARRTRLYLALLERTFAFDAKLSRVDGFGFSNFFDYGQAATAMAALLDHGVQWESVVEETLEWFTCYRFNYYGTPPLRRVLKWVAAHYAGQALPTDLRDLLITVRGQCSDGDYSNAETLMAVGDHPSYKGVLLDVPIEKLIDEIIGTGVWLTVPPCEHWAREALAKIERLEAAQKESWLAMLNHCHSAKAARPAGKWLKQAQVLAKAVGGDALVHSLLDWFPRVDDGRTGPVLGMCWENVDHRQRMHEVNATVLRGLLWICPAVATTDLTRIIGRIAASSYRKISGLDRLPEFISGWSR